MSSRVLRFIVEKNDSTVFVVVITEQLYVNWSEQQTQMRKTGYTWSHLSFQLCVSMRRYMDCVVCLTTPSWFQRIIHQSHQAALGVWGTLLQGQR